MASNQPDPSIVSELVNAIQIKRAQASQLLESMGAEQPVLDDNYFERLSIGVERRRAAVCRQLADWRQKRDQLEEAVREASQAERQSEPCVDAVCRLEASLDAAIDSNAGCVRRGFWDANVVDGRINDLIEALRINWEVDYSDRDDCCSAPPPKSEENSISQMSYSASVVSSSESVLEDVSTTNAAQVLQPETSSEIQIIARFAWSPVSAAFTSEVLIVLEVGSQKRISIFSPSGSRLGTLKVKAKNEQSLKFNPYRVRYCSVSNWIIIADQENKSVLCCSEKTGIVVASIAELGGQLNDVVSTGQQLVMCCPKARVYSASLKDLSDVKECTSNIKLVHPLRLAWCQETNMLVIVDRLESRSYRIQGYRINRNKLTAKSKPNVVLKSSVIPSVLINYRLLVIAWASHGKAIISWLPACAVSMTDELYRIVSNKIDPTDLAWMSTSLSSSPGTGNVVLCNRMGSIVSVRRPSA